MSRVLYTKLANVRTPCFRYFELNLWSWGFIFRVRVSLGVNNFGINHLLSKVIKKKWGRANFHRLRKYVKFDTVSGTVKIGVPPIFLIIFDNKWYFSKLYHKKTGPVPKYGAPTPPKKNFHPKLCWRSTHQFWCACASTVLDAKCPILGVGPPYFTDNRVKGPLGLVYIG